VFVIDGDGTIRYRWMTEDALVEPSWDEPIAVLAGVAGERG
jgi:peroxiredoxin